MAEQFGRYLLERKLGAGGMGEVWLARADGGSPVVIKRLHAHLYDDSRSVERFLDEVRLAQRLRHPNIVAVLDSGIVDERLYLAMEHIDGLHLRQCLVGSGGPMRAALAALLVADACAALEYAHTLCDEDGHPLHLAHRDVSPENVMVDVNGRVKLLDFGIARARNTEVTTQAGERRGKARYMAPEYIKGEDALPTSDVYSMGATLFELLTGRKPFEEHRNIVTIAQAAIDRGLPRADLVDPGIPAELATIVAAATRREAAHRTPTAGELERQLRRFLVRYKPPAPQQIGREVAGWRTRLDARPVSGTTPPPGTPRPNEATPPSPPQREAAPGSRTAAPRPRPGAGRPTPPARIDTPLTAPSPLLGTPPTTPPARIDTPPTAPSARVDAPRSPSPRPGGGVPPAAPVADAPATTLRAELPPGLLEASRLPAGRAGAADASGADTVRAELAPNVLAEIAAKPRPASAGGPPAPPPGAARPAPARESAKPVAPPPRPPPDPRTAEPLPSIIVSPEVGAVDVELPSIIIDPELAKGVLDLEPTVRKPRRR